MTVLPKPAYSVALLLWALLITSAMSLAQGRLTSTPAPITRTLVIWNPDASGADSVDQESYVTTMASIGLSASRIDRRDLEKIEFDEQTLLLVPSASSRLLSSNQVQRILGKVAGGLRLVTGGEGPILPALRVTLGEPLRVYVVIDKNLPDNHLHWADQPTVRWISGHRGDSTRVLYADSVTGNPLVVTGNVGKGKYIVLAPFLDPLSGNGYSRFPTLANAIVRDLECRPAFRRQAVDAYFDPGYRFSSPIDSLAALWRSWGIHALHASGWYYEGRNAFDYKKFIDAAHRNGIRAYLWLEWPHVGRSFWERHPEWREQNALLQDAKLDWLLLMDLQDPDCMKAALEDLARLLRYDWDGIDIAEFTITGAGGEALAGPSRPEGFVSFGPTMRREFKEIGGFDPIDLVHPNSAHFWKRDSLGLEKYYDYRKVVNNRLLRRVVEFVHDQEKNGKRDWELIHTIVDNSLHPEFDRMFGFDLDTTLQLVKQYGITLNVEDPYMEWEKPPVRYRHLRDKLLKLLPDQSSMIDINVVPIHPATQPDFASYQATGAEFLQQLQMASERHGRVCVYSEWTVFNRDWPLVPYAMSAGSTATKDADGLNVSVPSTVTLSAAGKGRVINNGRPWPCYGPEGIVVPAGTHRITFDRSPGIDGASGRGLRLLAISDELIDCRPIHGGVDIVYSSPARCLVSVSARPKRLFIDGVSMQPPILRADHYFVIVLPSGRHRLRALGN